MTSKHNGRVRGAGRLSRPHRHVPDGRSYEHRCPLAAYTAVAYAVEEAPPEGAGLTLEGVTESLRLPYT